MKKNMKKPLIRLLPAAFGLLVGASPAWSADEPGTAPEAGALPEVSATPDASAALAPRALAAPGALPLSELLGNSDKALTVLEAEAAAEAARQEVERERAESGLRFNIGGGYGIVRNIVDTNKAFTYPAAQAQAGFSYPLLGAAEQSDRRIDIAMGKQHEGEIKANAARNLAQLEIESAYARYWGAQESLKVVQAYLSSEPLVMPKLQLRAQHKLVLQSEALDTQAAYAQARGDEVRFKGTEDDARSRLERLSGRELGTFTAQGVQLPPVPPVEVESLLARHPDIAALKAQGDALKAQLHDTAWYGMEASFDITGAGSKDLSNQPGGGGPYGGTAFVGLNFKAPIGVFSARSAERKRLRAQMEEIRLQIQDRGQQLGGEVLSAQHQLSQSQQDDEQVAQRVQASSESLREGYLRGNVFAEEGVETMSRRLHTYYLAALQEIDSKVKTWLSNITVRGYAAAEQMNTQSSSDMPSDLGAQLADPIVQVDQMLQNGHASYRVPVPASQPEYRPAAAEAAAVDLPRLRPAVYTVPAATPVAVSTDPGVAPPAPRPATPPARLQLASTLATSVALSSAVLAPTGSDARSAFGVYVWHSTELIARQQDEGFWQRLQAMPVNRLLLGLNAQEIAEAQSDPKKLSGFLDAAKRHGVAVELLLGDAGWIDPAQRQKLVAIIDGLRRFEFAGLNLDIEPDQIYKQPLQQEQFEAWMQTLKSAARISPWPTGISVHPRYFRDPPYMSWGIEQHLRDAGVSEVVLMVYSSSPQKVADITRPIVSSPRAQGLRFRVAQSVEPELEPQLSYARRSPQDFRQSMQQLQGLLAAQPNTEGVVVQAWNDLVRMGGNESQIR
jgi:outer membrane protein TolC